MKNQSLINLLREIKMPEGFIDHKQLAVLLRFIESMATLNELTMLPSAELVLEKFSKILNIADETIRITNGNVTASLMIDVKKSFNGLGETIYIVTQRVEQR